MRRILPLTVVLLAACASHRQAPSESASPRADMLPASACATGRVAEVSNPTHTTVDVLTVQEGSSVPQTIGTVNAGGVSTVSVPPTSNGYIWVRPAGGPTDNVTSEIRLVRIRVRCQ